MDIDYRGITMEVSSIPAVTLQQATPSPRYYRKFHLKNRGISAVLPLSPLPCRAIVNTLDRVDRQNFEILKIHDGVSCHADKNLIETRMWADAQPYGRPAEYRWRPLFNATKSG